MLENSADILCKKFLSQKNGYTFSNQDLSDGDSAYIRTRSFLHIRCWFRFLSIVGGQLLVISREIRIIFEDELRFSDLGRPFFDFPR